VNRLSVATDVRLHNSRLTWNNIVYASD